MKKSILSKLAPVALFAFGIAGAFGTMSMQSDKNVAHVDGWVRNSLGQICSMQVDCSDIQGDFCRVSYPDGQQALRKPASVCTTALFKP